MEYWNTNVQGIRQVFDILHYSIIHKTRAEGTECEVNETFYKSIMNLIDKKKDSNY